ncbi:MAG: DEAD/DEAH box helicase [Alphaproteobacteria bacterium]|nr:DEAD/DEAH box helicase [Alphaproteobacteria bacterium]
MSSPFHDLGLSDALVDAVTQLGYESPTPIQAASIPIVLMGRDILGSAQTGTGKTASFTLPLIDILASGRAKARMPRSLILAPTRELAAQVAESFEKFSTNHNMSMALLIGGVSFSDQEVALDKGVDVLIATPGRLMDHFERGKVLLQDVKILVIDEADRMLDMGFIPDVERIVSKIPVMRQTLFFSATLSDEIHKIGSKFVMNPKIIEVSKPASTADTVSQRLIWTDTRKKRAVLRDLLRTEAVQNAVIFCNRKRDISTLLSSLQRHKFNAAALHGDMTQSARLAALKDFKDGVVPLLIASDVAARGLDIPLVSHVFNFDVPTNAEDYVHRIGRTGRAGRTGSAFTIAATNDDKRYLEAIEKLIGVSIELHNTDDKSQDKAAVSDKQTEQSDKSETATDKADTSENNSSGKPRRSRKTSQTKDASANQSATEAQGQASPSSQEIADKKDGIRNKYGEKRPPEWKGTSFKDSDHIPAFLK